MTNDLHRLRLELERIGVGEDGCLVRLPGPDPEDIARVLAVVFEDGTGALHVRADVPASRRERIMSLGPQRAYADDVEVRTIIRTEQWDRGTSYVFGAGRPAPAAVRRLGIADSDLLKRSTDPSLADLVARRPVFAIIEEGDVVATASSVRENDRAAEVWVITDPAHRGRGHAKQVVAAWANDAVARGLTAFYSHSDANVASAAVARSLRCRRWGRLVAYA